MKTVGIILSSIVFSLGLIVCIVIFNFYHVEEQAAVFKNKETNNINEKNDSTKIVTSIHTFECEVVEVAKEKNKFHQFVCEDGRKDGFTNNDILSKQGHPIIKVGDTVIASYSENGLLNVRLVIE